MIYLVKGRSERHERQIEFQALLHGLTCDTTNQGLYIECHRPLQMLHVIRQSGGTIAEQHKTLPMGRHA